MKIVSTRPEGCQAIKVSRIKLGKGPAEFLAMPMISCYTENSNMATDTGRKDVFTGFDRQVDAIGIITWEAAC